MISPADLREWDYHKLRTSVTKVAAFQDKESDDHLREFIDHIECLSKSDVRQIPALFKPKAAS